MYLLYIAIALFGITTVMGLYLSACVFLHKKKPFIVILLHGIFSIIGFTILISDYPASFMSVIMFLIATVFGVCLLYQHLTSKPFTKWFCFAHAILSIAGCVFLVRFAMEMIK
jgi:hypothetical protein